MTIMIPFCLILNYMVRLKEICLPEKTGELRTLICVLACSVAFLRKGGLDGLGRTYIKVREGNTVCEDL